MKEIVQRLLAGRVVGILRLPRSDLALQALEVAIEHGLRAVEVTMTTPNALEILRRASAMGRQGTGGRRDGVERAGGAGSHRRRGAVCCLADTGCGHGGDRIAGECAAHSRVFSPTEIVTAYRLGAPVVKVFPAVTLGAAFFKEVKAPLPQIPLMAVGGLNAHNAAEYLHAGADMVGVGGALFPKAAILAGEFEGVAQTAEALAALSHLHIQHA